MGANIKIVGAKNTSSGIVFKTDTGAVVPASQVSNVTLSNGRSFPVSQCKPSGAGVMIGSVKLPSF